MIDLKDIKAAVLSLFSDWEESPIVWPGVPADTSEERSWVEPDVQGMDPEATRPGDEFAGAEAVVKVFARDGGANLYELEELADKARAVLDGADLRVSGGPALRIREAAVGDLGRVESVRGLLVRAPLTAEE